MRFEYYERLSAKDRRTYRKSDAVPKLTLPDARLAELRSLAAQTEKALATDRVRAVSKIVGQLVTVLCEVLGAPEVPVTVRARRPRRAGAELHGLYTRWEDGRARIEVWMRTAAHEKVVRPRTFVRTVLHELCHHADYTVLELEDSFHTEGFFRRESNLVRDLLPLTSGRAKKRPVQLSLFTL